MEILLSFFRNLPLLRKLGWVFVVLFVSFLANFGIIDYHQRMARKDAAMVNMSARNKMLSQKIGFLAEMIARGKTVVRYELDTALLLYQNTLEVMKNGGVPMKMDSDLVFDAAPDSMRPMFTTNENLWWEYRKHARIVATETDPILKLQAISHLELNSEALLEISDTITMAFVQQNQVKQKRLNWLMAALLAFDLLLMLLSLYMLHALMVVPIRQMAAVAQHMAKGNLRIADFHKGKDEVGQLGKSLRKTTAILRSTILDIQSAAKQIKAAAGELSSNAQQISQGANAEAQATDVLNQHLKLLAVAAEENNHLSQRTRDIALASSEQIAQGKKAFEETIVAMQQIANTIKVVKDIAFQVDLLAVNASIEAARAGQAGRGFTVVAQEVRSLADQTHAAAHQIGQLAKRGGALAENSGQLLASILPQVEESSGMSRLIATSSAEQNERLQSLFVSVNELMAVSQQNASSSEEMAASSEQLLAQAQQLTDTAAFFKVRDT